VNEPEELKCFRLSLPSPLASFGGIPPKLQQASLVRVQRQAELA
jgi:hypothetical protein